MSSRPDHLSLAIERLQASDLMPPVKGVEMVGGGWIRVTVVDEIADEVRARIAVTMGDARWTLVHVSDDRAALSERNPGGSPARGERG